MNKFVRYAALVLVASIPANNMPLPSGLGSVNRALGFVVLGIWLLSIISRAKIRRLTLIHTLAFGFICWYGASSLWAVEQNISIMRFIRLLESAFAFFLLWDVLHTTSDVENALQAYVIGAYCAVAATVWNYHTGLQAREWEARFAGAGFDPCDIGGVLCM